MVPLARLGIVPAIVFGLAGCATDALRVDYAGDVAAKGKVAAAASRAFLVKVDETRVAANVDLIAIDPACVPDKVYTRRVPLLQRFGDVNRPPRGWLCSREPVAGVTQDQPLSLAPLGGDLEPTLVLIDALGAYSAAIADILDGQGPDPIKDLTDALDLARSAEGLLRSIAGGAPVLPAPDDPRLAAAGKFAGFLLDLRAEAEKAKALERLVHGPGGGADLVAALRGQLAVWELGRRDDENRRLAFSRLLLDAAQASEPPLPVEQRRGYARAFYERAAARTTAAQLKPALDAVLTEVGEADADLRRVLKQHPQLDAKERRQLARITRERVARGFDTFAQLVLAFSEMWVVATRDALLGSLGSLSDTLTLRWDPAASQRESARWLGVMTHLAAITHRTGALMALPEEAAGFEPIVAMLDDASRGIVTTGAAGLDRADAALAAVERLFDA